ncbi:MAG: hypothetical protein QXL51_06935 [Candidatus Aenigmatarchaeota archaeon]
MGKISERCIICETPFKDGDIRIIPSQMIRDKYRALKIYDEVYICVTCFNKMIPSQRIKEKIRIKDRFLALPLLLKNKFPH